MTPAELAMQARLNAAKKYRDHARYLEQMGSRLFELDPEGARAIWLDGMAALDCAATTLRSMEGGSDGSQATQ